MMWLSVHDRATIVPPALDAVGFGFMLSLSQALWSLLWAVIGGVAVWYGSNFLAEPISRFLRMREQIRSRMLHYENVGLGSGTLEWHPDSLRLHAAESEFREFATDLRGFADTRPYVTAMLGNVGYDLTRASGALIGLSNSLARGDGSRAKIFRTQVDRALKFPLSYPSGG
jgi:hypothetical protein